MGHAASEGAPRRWLRRVRAGRARIMGHWYEFQELLFALNTSWDRLEVEWRALHLSVPDVDRRTWPVSSFAATPCGVLQLVKRPRIAGGARGTILRCWTEQLAEAVVLRTTGEIDLSTISDLANAIAAALAQRRPLIVDLSRLDYLDAAGIDVLERTARRHPGRFVVVGSKPTIHKLFDILGLTDTLPVVHTLDDAQQYLRGR